MACKECEEKSVELAMVKDLEQLKAQVGWLQSQVATNTWRADYAYRQVTNTTTMSLIEVMALTCLTILGVWVFVKIAKARDECASDV